MQVRLVQVNNVWSSSNIKINLAKRSRDAYEMSNFVLWSFLSHRYATEMRMPSSGNIQADVVTRTKHLWASRTFAPSICDPWLGCMIVMQAVTTRPEPISIYECILPIKSLFMFWSAHHRLIGIIVCLRLTLSALLSSLLLPTSSRFCFPLRILSLHPLHLLLLLLLHKILLLLLRFFYRCRLHTPC